MRLYWLGPATEPGLWGIDSGPNTKVTRIQAFFGTVRSEHDLAHPQNKPRGWLVFEEIEAILPDGTSAIFGEKYGPDI